MASNNVDSEIKKAWTELYDSYCHLQLNSPQKSVETVSFDITSDTPLLSALIDNQDNKQQLEEELKQVIMKHYWNGYYNGVFNTTKEEK